MNNLKELEKLNTMGFKLLVFLPLVGFIGGLYWQKLDLTLMSFIVFI